jgi:hypothetical protein
MITAGEVVPRLLEACPSFEDGWAASAVKNLDDESPAGRLGYLDAGDFIRHLVALQQTGRTAEFPAVFGVIEQFLSDGDDYVQNLAVIGYLEGLQMRSVTDEGIDPDATFRPFFGPIANDWWDRINRFWAGDHQALQRPAE